MKLFVVQSVTSEILKLTLPSYEAVVLHNEKV